MFFGVTRHPLKVTVAIKGNPFKVVLKVTLHGTYKVISIFFVVTQNTLKPTVILRISFHGN